MTITPSRFGDTATPMAGSGLTDAGGSAFFTVRGGGPGTAMFTTMAGGITLAPVTITFQ